MNYKWIYICVAVSNRPSVVDDRFFKLSEMEHFLQYEDKREADQHNSSDESINFFQPTDDGPGEVCVYSFSMRCKSTEASFCIFGVFSQ
jgi:hypothetical protein